MSSANKVQPLSVVKIQVTNSPIMFNHSPNQTPVRVSQSPQLRINVESNPSANDFSKRQCYFNRFSKFFKKEISTHEKNLKKNPRIKLIENTQALINPKSTSFEKYILHSTKRLKIIAQSSHSKSQKRNPHLNVTTSYFISLPEPQYPDSQRQNSAQENTEQKRRRSQQSKRIFKGITSRKQSSKVGRFSVQLEKYKSSEDHQNEEDFVQHQKLNLYQSLIYSGNFVADNVPMPLTQSLGGDYMKLDRSKSPDDAYIKRTRKPRQALSRQSGFPTKKVQNNEPQVLTIHFKRTQNKFRSHMNPKSQKNSKQYYHPRPIPLSNINIFKRPNTTMVNLRNRRDSQIQPW